MSEPKNRNSGSAKIGPPKRGALDLGLGGIVGEGAPLSPAAPPNSASHPTRSAPLVAPRPAAPSVPAPRSEYALLADQGRWGELLALTEQRTAGGGHGELAPRFWWVRASVALGTVPLSILAAPLDTVSAELVLVLKRGGANAGAADLAPVAAALLAEVSSRLVTHTDYAGAVTFAERAFRLDGVHRGVLENVVGAVLKLPAPSARRDPGGARVRATCERLRVELGLGAGAPGVERSAPPADPARSGVERREALVPPAAPMTSGGDAAPPRGGGAPATKGGGTFSLVAFFVLIGGLAWFVRSETGLEAITAEGETSFALVVPTAAPVLAPPPLERMSKVSHLAAVSYDFDRGSAGGEPRPEVRRATPPRGAQTPERGLARIDTTGPIEPPEVLKARTFPEEPTEEDVSAILFGAPKPRFPTSRTGGSVSQAPKPVEQFSSARNYSVRVKTRVVTRPSFSGVAVAELAAGDSVLGEGLVGDWLKIRSRNGQVGYILAQDAIPRG